jgi:hypothetical protein
MGKAPVGPAPLIETTPVAGATVTAPVKPGAIIVTLLIGVLSEGALSGVMVALPPLVTVVFG